MLMSFFSSILKKGFFWSYPRTSWQWDVLCVLILLFIFLTPKSWFENGEFQRSRAAQLSGQQVIVLGADVVGAQLDRSEIERRVRLITGHPETEVVNVHQRTDPNGNVIGYEVDIR